VLRNGLDTAEQDEGSVDRWEFRDEGGMGQDGTRWEWGSKAVLDESQRSL